MNVSVGTFNIQHGLDYLHLQETGEHLINLKRVSDAIKQMNVDICGLNEVRNHEMLEGKVNQARVIAENLGYHFVFVKAIDHHGGEYGNALVSKYPILSCKGIPMKTVPEKRLPGNRYYEDRVLLCAEVLVEHQVLNVFVSHFGLNKDEFEVAVSTVCDNVKYCMQPTILMGDFNFIPDSPYYAAIQEMLYDTSDLINENKNTYSSINPTRRIDYIFVNDQVKTISAQVLDIIVSDHRPYRVTIDI